MEVLVFPTFKFATPLGVPCSLGKTISPVSVLFRIVELSNGPYTISALLTRIETPGTRLSRFVSASHSANIKILDRLRVAAVGRESTISATYAQEQYCHRNPPNGFVAEE